MAQIIVPIGFDYGPEYPADATETFHYEILSGGDSVQLTERAYRVWALAFPDMASHKDMTFTRNKLADIASGTTNEDIAACHRTIQELIDAGLLAAYEPDAPSAIDFLKGHKIYPKATGMGSKPDEPETYQIGRGGEVIVEVFHEIYAIWAMSKTSPNIWHAVEAFGTVTDPAVPSAEEIGYSFARVVPILVSLDVAYLEQV